MATSARANVRQKRKLDREQKRVADRAAWIDSLRNPTLTPEAMERAHAMRAAGMYVRDIAAELYVPKSTLHRALGRAGSYATAEDWQQSEDDGDVQRLVADHEAP